MEEQKRLSGYRRYLEHHRRRPTSEDESLMRLLGLKTVQELDQWFKERENGLPPRDLLDMQEMKPLDEAEELAMRLYDEEEQEEERREEITQLSKARNARIKPQLLRNLNHLSANPNSDPEVRRIVVEIGMLNFEAGNREFLKWSGRMVEELGERVRPILRDVWLRMPIEVRREGERKLRGLGHKPEEIREVTERIQVFSEIERKPLGLVDVTGKEMKLDFEEKARVLEPIPPPSPGFEVQPTADGVAVPPSTKQKANSPLEAAPEITSQRSEAVPKESFEGSSLHSHSCPVCGKYWTHHLADCESGLYCECDGCRQKSDLRAPNSAHSAREESHHDETELRDTEIPAHVAELSVQHASAVDSPHSQTFPSSSGPSQHERSPEVGNFLVPREHNERAKADLARVDRHGRLGLTLGIALFLVAVLIADSLGSTRGLNQYIEGTLVILFLICSMGGIAIAVAYPLRAFFARRHVGQHLEHVEVERMSRDFSAWIRMESEQRAEAHRRAVAADPNDSQAWCDLATEYRHLGQYDKAVEAYEQVLTIDPSRVQTWIDLGATYDHLKRYDKATEALWGCPLG